MRQTPMVSEAAASVPVLEEVLGVLDRLPELPIAGLRSHELGTVRSVGPGTVLVDGLPGVGSEELVRFPEGLLGMAFNLDPEAVGVVLLCSSAERERLRAGAWVRRTGRVLDVPVGAEMLGRVVDALGRPIDGRGPCAAIQRRPVEQAAPAILDRAAVTVPLQTGLKIVDALIPIGRGQRQLILGDRQTGKTAIALDTILNQTGKGVVCVYCAIGQRSSAVARLIGELRSHGALAQCIVVVAAGEDPPGLRFVAPYAATSMAEYFMERGGDALIVYDDLTRHAWAYRELSLLLRRPPGREAFPGDIFYIHSRLLERATHLRNELGGGSLTALPIAETEAQNVSAYIPTNLISITDGQVYLSPELFQKGLLPAVDVGRSVSRVGGKTQLPAYRAVAGDLRLAYSQFTELEVFSRFSTRLDPGTRRALERGQRVREVLKQPEQQPVTAAAQVVALLAVGAGLMDAVALEHVAEAECAVREAVLQRLPELCRHIEAGSVLEASGRERILETAREALAAAQEAGSWKAPSL
jgi:F-type H+/Na+-transporting ATPase subunit alpha